MEADSPLNMPHCHLLGHLRVLMTGKDTHLVCVSVSLSLAPLTVCVDCVLAPLCPFALLAPRLIKAPLRVLSSSELIADSDLMCVCVCVFSVIRHPMTG